MTPAPADPVRAGRGLPFRAMATTPAWPQENTMESNLVQVAVFLLQAGELRSEFAIFFVGHDDVLT